MAKASIQTKSGAKITVEGDSSEIAKIIHAIENAPHEAKKVASLQRNDQRERKKERTGKDLVIELKEESFFSKAKSLNEIKEELQTRGHLIPTTTLSGIMLGLVQAKHLRRLKKDGLWVYGQR